MNSAYFSRAKSLFPLIYLLISVLMTWPLILHINSSLLDGFGDEFGGVWGVWAGSHGLFQSPIIRLIAAPFGMINSRGGLQVFSALLYDIPAKFFGAIAVVNLFALLSFPVTAWAVYAFLKSILKDELAAFAGGLIFGFCPAAVIQAAGGHATFSLNFFIPILLWSLFYNREKRSHYSAFLVGISYVFLEQTCTYWGYFALYVIPFFFIFDYETRGEEGRADLVKNALIGAFTAILIVAAFEWRIILQMLTWGPKALAQAGRSRDIRELTTLSARPWEYFLPSIDHPIIGPLIEGWRRRHLHGSNLVEQTIYLGFTPVALCIWGVVLFYKRSDRISERLLRRFTPRNDKKDGALAVTKGEPPVVIASDQRERGNPAFGVGDSRQTYFLFFISAMIWTLFLSAPPYLPLGKINIPTISGLVFALFPMTRAFRVYARFGIWANFFMACAVSVVLAHLRNKMPTRRFKIIFATVLVLIGFEYWSRPPIYYLPSGGAPPVYLWLAQQPGDFIVAEYPMMPSDEGAFSTYLFWQRVHKKRLANGALPNDKKAWDFYEKVKDWGNPETPALLRQAGVRYVIVHDAMYADGQIPGPIKRYFPPLTAGWVYGNGRAPKNPAFTKPIQKFDSDWVFELSK